MKSVGFKIIFKYYWMQIQKYKWSFYGVFIVYGIATVLVQIFTPLVYRNIIDAVSQTVTRSPAEEALLSLLFILASLTVLYNIFYRVGEYLASYSRANITKALTDFSLQHLERHSYGFFANTFTGGLVAKTGRFVRAFERMVGILAYDFWSSTIVLLGVFIVLFRTNAGLGLYFFLWLLVYFLITVIFVKKKNPYNLAEAEADSKVTARVADFFTNILNVKMFASKGQEFSSFQAVTQERFTAQIRSWNLGNFQNAIQALLIGVFEIGGMYLAIKLWLVGEITGGTVVLIQLYTNAIFAHLWNLGRTVQDFAHCLSDAAEMVEIFEQPVEVLDPASPEACRIRKGVVNFQSVTFGYDPANPVLKDFSFAVRAGERVGLVGSSGAGKTTITKLLLRFADPQSGVIGIDGQNIMHITQDDLRRNIAYVPQDPVLFHRSLRENIAYGKPEASEEEIISAAKKAHAHEFISGFPQGYDTLVGERGVKLSGGERQRVAIARAILKNAPILVLDEATSSLDTISERYIQEGLEELMKEKTVIVIAHRLSTVRKMDRIVVLGLSAQAGESGIEEEGTHDELLEKGGTYAAFWNHQTDGLLA